MENLQSELLYAQQRIDLLRALASDSQCDAVFVSHLPAIRYLTRFSGSNASLFVTPDKLVFVSDDRYIQQVQTELYRLDRIEHHFERDVMKYVRQQNLLGDARCIGFDEGRTTVAQVREMQEAFPEITLKPLTHLTERIQTPKSPIEVAKLQKAAELADRTLALALPKVQVGVRESEIAAELVYQGRLLGAEKEAFDVIVASGPRSSWVHGRASDRLIGKGDAVTIDFGLFYSGFASDMTRTFFVGEVSQEQRSVYELVKMAHLAAIDAAHPGMLASDLDAVARQIIVEAGFGDYFRHSLGHGIGLEAHEAPIVSFRNKAGVLKAGDVITIEPGVYLPERFGVRIEDVVLITEHGAKVLTTYPRDLHVIAA